MRPSPSSNVKHYVLIKAMAPFKYQLRRDLGNRLGKQGHGRVKAQIDPEARSLLDLYGKMPAFTPYPEARLVDMEDCLAGLGFDDGFIATMAQRLQGMMDTSATMLKFKQAYQQIRYDTPIRPEVRREMSRRLDVFYRNAHRGNGDRYRVMDMKSAASKVRGD